MAKRSVARGLFSVLGIITIAGLLVGCQNSSQSRHADVEAAISQFEGEPTQANADVLAALLDNQVASAEQGERILALVLWPKVIQRKSYPAGKDASISAERQFNVRLRDLFSGIQEDVWGNGQHQHGGSTRGGGGFDASQQLHGVRPWSKEPGTYKFEIRCQYSCTPDRNWDKPLYKCEFSVPVEVVFVEEEKAEKVALVSNPELDRVMRATFTSGYRYDATFSYSTPSGRRDANGGTQIYYNTIPVATVFTYVFRYPDGREVGHTRGIDLPWRFRADSSGSKFIRTSEFALEKPGKYVGTVVLRADLEAAHTDPAIKTIWDGELEFPIMFNVEPSE